MKKVYCAWALGGGAHLKIHKNLPHHLSTTGGPTMHPICTWGGEWG